MHRSITTRCLWLALRSAVALALTIAPYQIVINGSVPGIHAADAQAGKGGNGNGNSGNGNGNGGSNGGGNGNGNSSGGNSGNGNSGNSGTDSGDSGTSSGQNDKGSSSHVNVATGDKVEVNGKNITVQHPDGITEKVENGRFKMEDALGRTIVERPATVEDISRLQAL